MDWAIERLGGFGAWLVGYRFSFLVLATIGITLFLLVEALRESVVPETSIILDSNEVPFTVQRVSKRWTIGFIISGVAFVFVISYGAYDFYNTFPLLKKYPLGYVTFNADYVTSAVTPLETRRGLEKYQFDFRPVKAIEEPNNRIAIQLPNVLVDGKLVISSAATGGPKKVGDLGGSIMWDKKTWIGIAQWAEILAINGSEITFLVGFTREKRTNFNPIFKGKMRSGS